MPKVGPNGKLVDPKVYAKRITEAKKKVAAIDPATKAQLSKMYPKVTKKSIENKTLKPKKTTAKPTPAPKKQFGPLPKKPTLDDFLMRGLIPPTKGKKMPFATDVVPKQYKKKSK